MDVRNQLLALVLCLVAGLTIAVAAAVGYTVSLAHRAVRDANSLGLVDVAPVTRDRMAPEPSPVPELPLAAEPLQRSRWLQTLLNEKTDELAAIRRQLAEQTGKFETLRKQYDELLAAATAAVATSRGQEPGGTPTDPVPERLEGEQLLSELRKSAIWEDGLVGQVEELRRALDEAQQEIVRLEMRLSDIAAAPSLPTEAAEAIVRSGRPAVDLFAELLHHESPAVRLWAIQMLGRMGRDAESARAALAELVLTADREPIRAAAAAALEAIDRPATAGPKSPRR